VWVLVDNVDKSWPVNGAQPEDILILRSLLEATRKLQRTFSRDKIPFNTVVFIRNDIYEHLLVNTPDKGKDTAVLLEWNDRDALSEVIRRRLIVSTEKEASFEELWNAFFTPHVKGQESFSYVLSRTLMRPRDLLRFLRTCINVAVNRGHETVSEADIEKAEETHSEDQLQEISFELHDIAPDYAEVVYAFIGCPSVMSRADVEFRLASPEAKPRQIDSVIDLLLWFGFLGVQKADGEETYAYEFQYGVKRMLKEADGDPMFVIHPAFRVALGCDKT
jgi:predicted CopG family antitoxin